MKKKLTKEEKELVIKDLLSRIPTDLLVKVPGEEEPKELKKRVRWMITFGRAKSLEDCLEGLIPYLRILSSMTKEEKEEYNSLVAFSGNPTGSAKFVDWLNKKMFAYRTIDGKDMFELGLALEAPNGMYNLNEE